MKNFTRIIPLYPLSPLRFSLRLARSHKPHSRARPFISLRACRFGWSFRASLCDHASYLLYEDYYCSLAFTKRHRGTTVPTESGFKRNCPFDDDLCDVSHRFGHV